MEASPSVGIDNAVQAIDENRKDLDVGCIGVDGSKQESKISNGDGNHDEFHEPT